MVWLTVQTYLDGCWHDACELHFEEPDVGRYGKVLHEYDASATDGMKLWNGLRDFALTLQDAPRYAEESGVPEAVLNIKRHALNLRGIPERLKHWGLI